MAYNYSDEISFSKEMIEEFGTEAKIKRKSNIFKDVARPWLGTTDTFVDYDCVAVVYPADKRFVGVDTIVAGDQVAYVPASGLAITPIVGDLFWAGKDMNIIQVLEIAPNVTNKIIFTLILRK